MTNKILVTGGSGFIGTNFIKKSLQKNNKILNVDSLTYASGLKNLTLEEKNKNYFFKKSDICNQNKILKIISDFKPGKIIHFAAESHVDRSIEDASKFINTNIIGTYTLLESVNFLIKKKKLPENFIFHHVSTDEVFGTLSLKSKKKFNENTPYLPRSPYSASKASSDHLVNSYFHTYNLPTIITHCSNNYGPYQFPEKFIPVVIINALNEEMIPLYGNGLNIRDWIFVDDHVEALQTVLEKGFRGNTYNIGGNNELSNFKLAHKICKILDKIKPAKKIKSYKELIHFVPDRPGHDLRYAVNINKIKKDLNWRPKTTFDLGLLITIQWYLNNRSWWKNAIIPH